MRRVAQVTADFPNTGAIKVWVDLLEIPETVNDLSELRRTLEKDTGRDVRVVDILEG